VPDLTFVLIHSPIVGPMTWLPVADEIRRRGHDAIVPSLLERWRQGPPYWRRHVDAVVAELRERSPSTPLVLTGHSGAGPLLPQIGSALPNVAGYVFVDAGLRKDQGRPQGLEIAKARGDEAYIPAWANDPVMTEVLPDPMMRARFLEELPALPLDFFDEPVPEGELPDARCGYLLLSEVYRPVAAEALARGWVYQELDGHHFSMLTEPARVGEALLGIARDLRVLAMRS
jgi:hypothetical protein